VDVGAHALFLFVVLTPGVCYYLVLVVDLVQRNGSFYDRQEAPTWISTFRKFHHTWRGNLVSGTSLLLVLCDVDVFFADATFRTGIWFLQHLQWILLGWPRYVMIILSIFEYRRCALFQYLWKIVIFSKLLCFNSRSKFLIRWFITFDIWLLVVLRI